MRVVMKFQIPVLTLVNVFPTSPIMPFDYPVAPLGIRLSTYKERCSNALVLQSFQLSHLLVRTLLTNSSASKALTLIPQSPPSRSSSQTANRSSRVSAVPKSNCVVQHSLSPLLLYWISHEDDVKRFWKMVSEKRSSVLVMRQRTPCNSKY